MMSEYDMAQVEKEKKIQLEDIDNFHKKFADELSKIDRKKISTNVRIAYKKSFKMKMKDFFNKFINVIK